MFCRREIVSILSFFFMLTLTARAETDHYDRKLIIIGGGHVGLITAALAHERALARGERLNITIVDKNKSIHDTTAANIWNSHTDDEIASVVPRGAELKKMLKIPFNKPGGIFVPDVPEANDSKSAQHFIEQVTIEGDNIAAHERRSQLLLALGHAGMARWKQFFSNADPKLRAILEQSNFNPCCELDEECATERFKGYRIDLIYNMPNAEEHAQRMVKTYSELGYQRSRILSPDDVAARDPSLAHFCAQHSVEEKGGRTWRDDSSAVWRPGGCLDTQRFLPHLVDYLTKAMGTYTNERGETKNRFAIKYDKRVSKVVVDKDALNNAVITGLEFADGSRAMSKNNQEKVHYVFAPGESVGTLHDLGFAEPAYAGFAGASLSLEFGLSPELAEKYSNFNHYMEVHRPGTVLAWQARVRDGKIFVGGAGTKAFYGDVVPQLHESFAREKNLLQLQMFNDVLPDIVSIALGRDTTGQDMTFNDLDLLVEMGIAKRWVGRRAVVFDGFPTAGWAYFDGERVKNAEVTTHLGSGGGSFSLIVALLSTYAVDPDSVRDELESLGISAELATEILQFADSRRKAQIIGAQE